MTGSPAIFFPRISGSAMFWSSNAWLPISSDKATASRLGLGSSMPITLRPGMVATRADNADMLRAMSSASWMTRLALIPLAGSSSYMVTTGPGRTSTMSPRTWKSSSTDLEQPRVALEPGAVDLLLASCRARARAGRRSEADRNRRARGSAGRLAALAAAGWRRSARGLGHGDRRARTRRRGGNRPLVVVDLGPARGGAALARFGASAMPAEPARSSGVRPSAR